MEWYQYIAAFFAGIFCANTVPHFVKGISGDPFPTPFAKPPGKGLSSPVLNTVWSLINLLVAGLLYKASALSSGNNVLLLVFFGGIAIISIYMSKHFTHKEKPKD